MIDLVYHSESIFLSCRNPFFLEVYDNGRKQVQPFTCFMPFSLKTPGV